MWWHGSVTSAENPPETSSTAAAAQERAERVATSRGGRLFYRLTHVFIRVVLYRYFRVRRRGADHLDTPGPLVLAPVHRSNLDAPLVAGMAARTTRALGKESLFTAGPVGWVMSALGGFPVHRGAADRQSMRIAEQLLADGAALFVFPEGTRQTGDLVGEIFDGPAFLAARTGAKVVPIGIAGTEAAMPPGGRFPRRSRCAVIVGEPMDPPDTGGGRLTMSARKAYTDELRTNLQRVFDEAQTEAEQL